MIIFVSWLFVRARFRAAKIRKNKQHKEIFLSMRRFMRHIMVILLLVMAGVQISYAQYDKDVFFMRGRHALADGKYSLAIENFNILSQLDTSDYWTFFFRGIAKYNLGDLRGAKRDFDRSVRLNPVFTSGYHYRGITESRFGNYDAALADLQTAIDLRPGSEGLYFSRGVTYFLSQQFEKAVKDFDRYIRKAPKDPSAYLNRGASYLFLGDTLKAVKDYNKAIKLDRFDPEGYVRRGRLYASQKNYDLAIADMDKAIELDTTNTFAYFNRAIMYYEQEKYHEAMADLNRVLKDEPGMSGVSSVQEVQQKLADYYTGSTMVQVADTTDTAKVYANAKAGQDSLTLIVAGNDEQFIITALFDNLGKGASGAAVQNMNIMLGLDETAGLTL